MKILALSSVYPNQDEPGLGLFVRSRLQHVANYAEVKVLAPIPVLDYSSPTRHLIRFRDFQLVRWDGLVEVFHPRWVYPPYGTPVNVLFQFARLFPVLTAIRKRFTFDLIDAHFGYPEGAAASLLAAAFDVPFTITLRGSETIFDRYRYRRAVMQAALRRASRIITVSDELRDFAVSRGAAPERTRTIPNGIDRDIFRHRDPVEMRRRHQLSVDRKVIISAGELIEAKGHHHVLEGLRHTLAHGVDAELVIAGGAARGGPPFEGRLRSMVRRYNLEGRVRFAGWVDRASMAELLSAADLFCLASFTEGWPNVVHEALACGTPVVVTQVGGVLKMVASDSFGSIVPLGDQAALNHAIVCALQRTWDRSAISEWGRSRSWDTVAREVIAVFEEVTALHSSCRDLKKASSRTAVGSL